MGGGEGVAMSVYQEQRRRIQSGLLQYQIYSITEWKVSRNVGVVALFFIFAMIYLVSILFFLLFCLFPVFDGVNFVAVVVLAPSIFHTDIPV